MVLIIIGLLLGAVLKGQELIASAQVGNLISSMNGYKAAINAFQDRYRIVPGDSSTAATIVGNGAVNCSNLSCNNRTVDGWSDVTMANNHLAAAGFYSGPALTASFEQQPSEQTNLRNPGGGPIMLYTSWFYADLNGATGHRRNITGVWTGGKLSSKLLGEVDRKVDDGNGWGGECVSPQYSRKASAAARIPRRVFGSRTTPARTAALWSCCPMRGRIEQSEPG